MGIEQQLAELRKEFASINEATEQSCRQVEHDFERVVLAGHKRSRRTQSAERRSEIPRDEIRRRVQGLRCVRIQELWRILEVWIGHQG